MKTEMKNDLRVVKASFGSGWTVIDGDGRTIKADFQTNAAAWAWADRFASDYLELRKKLDTLSRAHSALALTKSERLAERLLCAFGVPDPTRYSTPVDNLMQAIELVSKEIEADAAKIITSREAVN
jgi:hypothetical protein